MMDYERLKRSVMDIKTPNDMKMRILTKFPMKNDKGE